MTAVCLLCGCSNAETVNYVPVDSKATEGYEDGTVTVKLSGICINEGEGSPLDGAKSWSLSDCSHVYENAPYQFNAYGLFDDCSLTCDYYERFSSEKGDSVFMWFENCNKTQYEPYHPNEDGVMVTEYKPYSVKSFYLLFDSEGNIIANVNDSQYDKDLTEQYFTLSETDYNTLKNMLDDMRKAIVTVQYSTQKTTNTINQEAGYIAVPDLP